MSGKSQSRVRKLPSLAFTVFVLTMLIFAGAMSVAVYVVIERISETSEKALAEAANVRGRGLAAAFLGSLYRTWSELQDVAVLMSAPGAEDSVADKLTSLKELNSAVAWGTFAELDGIVEHATNGMLEGESVAAQAWFAQGLEGPVATYEVILKPDLTSRDRTGQQRSLDLAVPVLGPARQVRGVVAVHIELFSIERHFRELADALEVEAFLVSSSGDVVIAPEGSEKENLDTPSIRAARVGVTRPFIETSPSGERYMMDVRSQLSYRDLPSFGWSLIVRIPADNIGFESYDLGKLAIVAAGMLVILLVVTFLYVRLYIRPATKLAESATAIADGQDVYPYETRRTREYAAIAAAIAVLQGQARR